jgi:predicted nucleic acid-binding protein
VTLVVDASAMVAALVDDGPAGWWAKTQIRHERLAAPQHMPVEASSAIRRLSLSGSISDDAATLAHDDLLQLRLTVFGYRGLGERVWQLRANVSPHDAWYVALAEALEVPLVTLDRRLARSHGPRCEFRVPPEADTIQTGME